MGWTRNTRDAPHATSRHIECDCWPSRSARARRPGFIGGRNFIAALWDGNGISVPPEQLVYVAPLVDEIDVQAAVGLRIAIKRFECLRSTGLRG